MKKERLTEKKRTQYETLILDLLNGYKNGMESKELLKKTKLNPILYWRVMESLVQRNLVKKKVMKDKEYYSVE